jgi:hypothetical protein
MALSLYGAFTHNGKQYWASGLTLVTKDTGEIAWNFGAKTGEQIWVTNEGKVYSNSQVQSGKVTLPRRSDDTSISLRYDEDDAVPNDIVYKGVKFWPTGSTRVSRGRMGWEMEAANGSGKTVWLDSKGRVSERSQGDTAIEATAEPFVPEDRQYRGFTYAAGEDRTFPRVMDEPITYNGEKYYSTGKAGTNSKTGARVWELESYAGGRRTGRRIWMDAKGNVYPE